MSKDNMNANGKDIKNTLQAYEMLLIMSVLKMYTGEKKAFSISELTRELNDQFLPLSGLDSDPFSERTLYRKINHFISPADSEKEMYDHIKRMLLMLTGGSVQYRSADGIVKGINTNAKGTQRRYFFETLLSNSDLDMICGTLMSSRYLSDDEKDYLLSRLDILKSGYDESDFEQMNRALFGPLPARYPTASEKLLKTMPLPSDNSVMLSHIKTIYEAIQNEYRIEVTYGMYDIRESSSRVTFHPRNDEKPYVLNPYAMMWNDGEYYLIATHYNYKNPVHFRIDRIVDVKIGFRDKKDKNGKKIRVPASRNPIPPLLAPFFRKHRGRYVFDNIAYTNRYPGMKIYREEDLTDCCFECTSLSLQILIDNFGNRIKLGETPLSHPAGELEINGMEKHYITATVTGIQREHAVDFAVENADTLTLLSPADVMDEVRDRLKKLCEKYQKISER
ncbi:MAG: WYL domain-containing protein [Lachnospiraceae bacterium]|nr:WYL domain-containing protein [Lachnospiraceae bacterium]